MRNKDTGLTPKQTATVSVLALIEALHREHAETQHQSMPPSEVRAVMAALAAIHKSIAENAGMDYMPL